MESKNIQGTCPTQVTKLSRSTKPLWVLRNKAKPTVYIFSPFTFPLYFNEKNELFFTKFTEGMIALQHIRICRFHMVTRMKRVRRRLLGLTLYDVCSKFRKKNFSHKFLIGPSQAFKYNFGNLSASKDRLLWGWVAIWRALWTGDCLARH